MDYLVVSTNKLYIAQFYSVGLQTSKSTSPTTEKHTETEIAEFLYGLKSSSRNQNSPEKLQTNGVYGNAFNSFQNIIFSHQSMNVGGSYMKYSCFLY